MTTILSARRGSQVALGGDGQVTLGAVVGKASSPANSAGSIMRKFLQALLAAQLMPLLYSNALKAN